MMILQAMIDANIGIGLTILGLCLYSGMHELAEAWKFDTHCHAEAEEAWLKLREKKND